MRLGIEGLPESMGRLMPGAVYAFDLAVSASRLSVMVGLLRANVGAAAKSVLITALPPEDVIARLRAIQAHDVLERLRSGTVLILAAQTEVSKNIFRYGAEHFTEELGAMGVEPGSLLLIDCADSIFTTPDPGLCARQMAAYRRWCKRNDITAMLFFLLRPSRSYPESYRGIADRLSGLARVAIDGREQVLFVDYWSTEAGITAGACFGLHSDSAGNLRLAGPNSLQPGSPQAVSLPPTMARQELPAAADDALVLHNCAEVSEQADCGALTCEYYRSFAALAERARAARCATVLLAYDRDMPLQQIAERVFLLRRLVRPELRIVIQEAAGSLRYSGTALLLKLGANLVVGRIASRARLAMQLRSLRGQIWRGGDVAFEAALASAQPTELAGCVPLRQFADAVEYLLEQAAALAIPCQLLVLRDLRRERIVELLNSPHRARPGDLIAGTHDSVMLFLFACDSDESPEVARRLLAGPIDPGNIHRYGRDADIRRLLDEHLQSAPPPAHSIGAERTVRLGGRRRSVQPLSQPQTVATPARDKSVAAASPLETTPSDDNSRRQLAGDRTARSS